jgi:hypothetical protein
MGRSARGVSVQLEARPVWSGSSAQSRRFEGLDRMYRLPSAKRPRPVGADHDRPDAYLKDCG